jgi:hypothetical protein
MKQGSLNEDNIAAALNSFIVSNSGGTYELVELAELGLVSRQDREYLSTSVDRIARVKEDECEVEFIAAVEFKTMSCNRTCREALHRVASFEPGDRCIDVMFGDGTFKKLVWNQTYRAQLLHHVVVIQTNLAVLLVATTTRILYTVFVRFLEADINPFISLADGIYHKHLKFGNDMKGLDFKHAVDAETFRLWMKLGNAITGRNQSEMLKPNGTMLKPAHAIVPKLVSMWNSLKGWFVELPGALHSNICFLKVERMLSEGF